MTWIPMDTRLAEHPKVLAMAAQGLDRRLIVGLLHDLWSRLAELETETLDGTPELLEQGYHWPEGFVKALEKVGWAKVGKATVQFGTRNPEATERKRMRRERAKAAADARWHANGDAKAIRASPKHDARRMQANATDRERDIQKDRHSRASAPSSGGEGGGMSASAAMREALRATTPRTGRNPDVLAQLRTLSDQTNGSQPERIDGTQGSVDAAAAGGG